MYRAFSEIDLRQLVKLRDLLQEGKESIKSKISQIEPDSIVSLYGDNTFFSLFADQGEIYEVIYDQVKMNDQSNEKRILSNDEFKTFMRRMRYVITHPTIVHKNEEIPENAKLTILKQCILFKDQKSRISLYRLAEFIPDLNLTNYISCTSDLNAMVESLPSAQYYKVLDKFHTNVYTETIREAVMPKKVYFSTFQANTPIITSEHEGIKREITDGYA